MMTALSKQTLTPQLSISPHCSDTMRAVKMLIVRSFRFHWGDQSLCLTAPFCCSIRYRVERKKHSSPAAPLPPTCFNVEDAAHGSEVYLSTLNAYGGGGAKGDGPTKSERNVFFARPGNRFRNVFFARAVKKQTYTLACMLPFAPLNHLSCRTFLQTVQTVIQTVIQTVHGA